MANLLDMERGPELFHVYKIHLISDWFGMTMPIRSKVFFFLISINGWIFYHNSVEKWLDVIGQTGHFELQNINFLLLFSV